MKTFPEIGVQIPEILLPKPGIDMQKWAVIACDQFTSQPEYWQKVEKLVGNAPSTLRLILPEVYLEQSGVSQRIQDIQHTMRSYLEQGLFQSLENLVYVERTVNGKVRKGLLLALDLEKYDYTHGSQSLIRATEGTIIDRLPPRIRIRENAPLELPHILVLIDDPHSTVIDPLAKAKQRLKPLYNFELMFGSGHLTGYAVTDQTLEQQVISALSTLANPQNFATRYQVPENSAVLLFAMGDGNHSLATAKAIWEKIKPRVGLNHPARYALVEIENLHDPALTFEPIHRLLFGLRQDFFDAASQAFGERLQITEVDHVEEVIQRVDQPTSDRHLVGYFQQGRQGVLEIRDPQANLPVGSLQPVLDAFLHAGGAEKIDYIHGREVLEELGRKPGNLGLYLPGMDKNEIFRTVILDGALPRKTFSMGEAHEKRFYVECRRIG
jgi:hypothetical protein